jgi:hypothetical protein
MPRARTTTALEDEGVVKKPRATRVRAVSSGEDAPVKAPRKRTPRAAPVVPVESEPVRKAPTPFREQKRASGTGTRNLIIVVVLCLILVSTGFGIGLSDKGQINVVAVVNERNEKINRGEVRGTGGETITQTIPVQGSDSRPNGGLQIADQPPPAPPETPAVIATTTATTTEAVSASSTESSAETATSTPLE